MRQMWSPLDGTGSRAAYPGAPAGNHRLYPNYQGLVRHLEASGYFISRIINLPIENGHFTELDEYSKARPAISTHSFCSVE